MIMLIRISSDIGEKFAEKDVREGLLVSQKMLVHHKKIWLNITSNQTISMQGHLNEANDVRFNGLMMKSGEDASDLNQWIAIASEGGLLKNKAEVKEQLLKMIKATKMNEK